MSRLLETLFAAAYVSGALDRSALASANGVDAGRVNASITASLRPENQVSPITARPHEPIILFTDAHSRVTPGRPSGSGVGRVRH